MPLGAISAWGFNTLTLFTSVIPTLLIWLLLFGGVMFVALYIKKLVHARHMKTPAADVRQ